MEIPAVTIAVTSVIIFLLTHLRHHLQSHRVVMAELLCNWKQGHLWGQTMLVREHLVRSWKVEGWRLHSFAVATCFTAFEVYPYPVWTSLVSVCACCFLSFLHVLLWRIWHCLPGYLLVATQELLLDQPKTSSSPGWTRTILSAFPRRASASAPDHHGFPPLNLPQTFESKL